MFVLREIKRAGGRRGYTSLNDAASSTAPRCVSNMAHRARHITDGWNCCCSAAAQTVLSLIIAS